jgi:hypothetical protein
MKLHTSAQWFLSWSQISKLAGSRSNDIGPNRNYPKFQVIWKSVYRKSWNIEVNLVGQKSGKCKLIDPKMQSKNVFFTFLGKICWVITSTNFSVQNMFKYFRPGHARAQNPGKMVILNRFITPIPLNLVYFHVSGQ